MRRLRDEVKETKKTFDKTEDDLKALQSMGQIIGEVLRQLDDERCAFAFVRVCPFVPLCFRFATFSFLAPFASQTEGGPT